MSFSSEDDQRVGCELSTLWKNWTSFPYPDSPGSGHVLNYLQKTETELTNFKCLTERGTEEEEEEERRS